MNYIFDGEYLILNTGGTAFTNYVNGKFSAMSDCLVVKPNSEYSITIYYWLKAVEKWINEVGFQGTGLKHLDINWLLRQKVKRAVQYQHLAVVFCTSVHQPAHRGIISIES